MVTENRKERLMEARAVVASKRARAQAAQGSGEGADALAAAEADARVAASDAMDGAAADAATLPCPSVAIPLPLQAREVSAVEEPRAHITCKRCAATVPADATECWNCSLPL